MTIKNVNVGIKLALTKDCFVRQILYNLNFGYEGGVLL